MSRMLAALKKLEETGQFMAPPPVAISAPAPAVAKTDKRQEASSSSVATSVLAPPAPPSELAEVFSGDPAEDYGRDLQCIEEQLAWAEALRAELLAEEQREVRAEEEAASRAREEARREEEEAAQQRAEEVARLEREAKALEREQAETARKREEEHAKAARLAAEIVAQVEEEEDDEPTVLETPGWDAQVAAAPRAEVEPPWVARPLAPMPRREGPLKVPFGAPHAPVAPPLQTQPSEARPIRMPPPAPPSEQPETDEQLPEKQVADRAKKKIPEPAKQEPTATAPVELPQDIEKKPLELPFAPMAAPNVEPPAPGEPVSFGPPLEAAERLAMLTPATGEEHEQLAATCDRLLALLAERDARVCFVSSVGGGEEAARLSVQLAMQAVERVEKRVLVVEGDLGRRRVSRATLELPHEVARLHDAQEARVLADISPRLMLLPAAEGEAPVAYRQRIVAHLCRHLGWYSLVLIEGGGERSPEIPEIAAICDAAVLHVPLGQVEIAQTQVALDKLHSWGVTVVGSIVSGASAAEAAERTGHELVAA